MMRFRFYIAFLLCQANIRFLVEYIREEPHCWQILSFTSAIPAG